jgi:hypothetical protein
MEKIKRMQGWLNNGLLGTFGDWRLMSEEPMLNRQTALVLFLEPGTRFEVWYYTHGTGWESTESYASLDRAALWHPLPSAGFLRLLESECE